MRSRRTAPDVVFTTASPDRIADALSILEPMLRVAEKRAESMVMRVLHSLAVYRTKIDSPVAVTTSMTGGMPGLGRVRTVIQRTASLSDRMPEPGRTPSETNGYHKYDLSSRTRRSSVIETMLCIRQIGDIPGTVPRRIDQLGLTTKILGTVVDALRTASIDGRRITDPSPISHAASERAIRAAGGEIPMMDLGPLLQMSTPVTDTAWASPTATARVGMIDENWKHSQTGKPMEIELPVSWTMRVMIHDGTLIVELDQTITPFEHDRDPVKTMRGEAMLAAVKAA